MHVYTTFSYSTLRSTEKIIQILQAKWVKSEKQCRSKKKSSHLPRLRANEATMKDLVGEIKSAASAEEG